MSEHNIPPRVSAVIHWVAAEHGLPVGVLLGRSQVPAIAEARRVAIRGVRCLEFADGKPPSFPRIGRWFKRHHTTIMHHCRDLESLDGEQGDLFEAHIPVNSAPETVDRLPKRETMAA